MVARAFMVAVVVGLEQCCRARAVVVRLGQWLLEHSWWQWL